MRFLLDTHVLVWWDTRDPRLAPAVRNAIADPANQIFVSAASIWEISIKRALGKLAIRGSPTLTVELSGFMALPVALSHAERAGELPRHHTDPFDRMLVAQAEIEELVLATQDRRMMPYGVPLLGLEDRR